MVRSIKEEQLGEQEQEPAQAEAVMSIERLQELQAQYEKEEPTKRVRLAKPRKLAGRQYRLVTDFEAGEIWRRTHEGQSTTVIAKALYMRQPTVFHALKRMRERGGLHVDARMLNGRKTATKITPSVAKMLLSQEVLERWSGLFVSQRLAILRHNHDVHIGATTLKDFYRKHKVKYLRVSYQYYQALARGPA